jgi:lysophospholipase L1-like esterase
MQPDNHILFYTSSLRKYLPRNFLIFILITILICSGKSFAQADASTYLKEVKTELKKEYPANRTINIVFHGHSVPAGYFKTPVVNSLKAYPFLVLQKIKERYPTAVVNVIVTAIGGENSERGEKRFKDDVLTHKPDVLFIDYTLNDRSIGLERSTAAMRKMIDTALGRGIKIILLTPTPHQNFNILDTSNAYEPYAKEVIDLAKLYNIGLVDSYHIFKEKISSGHSVTDYMSQVNHPNEAGHNLISEENIKWFN